MRLYAGTTTGLAEDSAHNRIASKLRDAFFREMRYEPSPSEVGSWRNSLRAVSQAFEVAELDDHGVLIEYQLPQTSKRLDCIVTGRDAAGRDQAVIIELKQWERCREAFGNKVVSFVGGDDRQVLHPSVQVHQYETYLRDCHSAFYEDPPVLLSGCAYLHNYEPVAQDALFAERFSEVTRSNPAFTGEDVPKLAGYLDARLSEGEGREVLQRVERSKFRASKKLLEHVGALLRGKPEYTLLDEQLVAFERVMACAREGFSGRRKAAIIIRGGPGTGKSVIALNLLSALSREGLNAHYVTGSRAFTGTLREIVGPRASAQVKFFNSYAAAEVNAVDVMICDESHRIRKTSNHRFTPAAKRSNSAQVDELFHAAKVGVYLLDDQQVVKPDEIGSSAYIRERAQAQGVDVHEYDLEAQFRCAGNAGFVNWVDNTLGIRRTANVLWNLDEGFEFRICGGVEELDARVRDKADRGFKARLTAGFCWPWSQPNADGTLVDDVVVGDFRRPWNARPEAKRLVEGIPPAPLWAFQPEGFGQVGCVYTAQGFEFDYVGVIFGPDLVYRHDTGWRGQREHSHDGPVKRSGPNFERLVKNTYRVLLTRGLKGCFVYFLNNETGRFFRSRTEKGDC